MSLRGWRWDAVGGPAGLGNRPLLEALAVALPDATVEAVIERTGTREQRRRLLPTHWVVTLVVGMGLWAAESVRHVLAEVVSVPSGKGTASAVLQSRCAMCWRRW